MHNTSLPNTAAVAFLNCQKAYDTVSSCSRPFLLAYMEAVGAGPGLARLVQIDSAQPYACHSQGQRRPVISG
jgi:hypothetical protein